jgi:hypothetical protein
MRVDGVADLMMEVGRGLRLRAVEVWDVRLVDADKVAVTPVVQRVRREELMDRHEVPRDLGQVEELDLLAVDEGVERVREPRYGVPTRPGIPVTAGCGKAAP